MHNKVHNKQTTATKARALGTSQNRPLFRVEFTANGIDMSGLAIGGSREEVWETYSKMNTSREPLTVSDVFLEPA